MRLDTLSPADCQLLCHLQMLRLGSCVTDQTPVPSKEIAPLLVVDPATDRVPESEVATPLHHGFRCLFINSAVEAVIANGQGFPTRVGVRRVGELAAEADGDMVGSAADLLDSDFEIPILGAPRLSRGERVV